MSFRLGIFLSGLLFSFLASASQAPSPSWQREPLVIAAYRTLPVLLNYVEQLKNFDSLFNSHDRKLFKRVIEIANSGQVPLEFSDDRESFRLNPGEPERLMRSTGIQDTDTGRNLDDGKILVNRALLNGLEVQPDLATILKLLFHEVAHKTAELDWGVRDRLAQVFENQIAPHISVQNVREDADLIVLSLPASRIDKQIGQAAQANEPLPTNLILLRLGDGYVDLTDNMQKRTIGTTALLRSMWTEANRVIYMIMRQMAKAMTQAMRPVFEGFLKPMMKAFGGDVSGMDDPFEKLEQIDVKEIRTLEVHEARSSSIQNGIFISMRATYTIGRTDKTQMPIQVSGFHWQDSYPVPVMIHVVVPTGPGQNPDDAQVDVQMRPNADYLTTGRSYGISRQNGVISTLKVKFKYDAVEPVERVSLILHYGMGHLTLNAARIEKLENGQVEAVFEIPASFYPPQVALVADAVLVNSERTVFLDRLITLSGDDSESVFVPHSELNNEFVDGSVGIWGLQAGKPTFRNHFQFREPVWIIDNVSSPNFTLNHSALRVEFLLRKEQKIREIRFYMKRSLIALDTTPDEGKEAPQIVTAEFDGRKYRFANGGKMKEQKDVHDITSIDASEIYSAYLPNGHQKVQAVLSVPFRILGSVATGDGSEAAAYAPPMGYPFLLEVVTENLQTLRYYFQDPNAAPPQEDCEDILKGAFENLKP